MASPPLIIQNRKGLRAALDKLRQEEQTIALVPTMGALHEGHLSLIDQAKELADCVVCSIFVNPKQFGAGEDLDTYPRQLETDVAALGERDTELVFAPQAAEIYGDDFQTTVSVSGVSEGLCGAARPGHFDGVATVVAKLLLLVLPDVAIFGEKDYQQLMVIRQMVKDLAIPVRIEGVPIVRAFDGLALSSRNAYLTGPERALAPLIHETLKECRAGLHAGRHVQDVLQEGAGRLSDAGFTVDYFELRHAQTLMPLKHMPKAGDGRLLVAAKLGHTRLIDNLAV